MGPYPHKTLYLLVSKWEQQFQTLYYCNLTNVLDTKTLWNGPVASLIFRRGCSIPLVSFTKKKNQQQRRRRRQEWEISKPRGVQQNAKTAPKWHNRTALQVTVHRTLSIY